MTTLPQAIYFLVMVLALGPPAVVIIKSAFDFWRRVDGRAFILLKGLAGLALWFVFSWAMMFMLFVTVFAAAHTSSSMSNDGIPDPAEAEAVFQRVIVYFLGYAFGGAGLSYWMFRPSRSAIHKRKTDAEIR